MTRMKTWFGKGTLALLLVGAGCVGETDAPSESQGNDALGIASFEVNDSNSTTTVVGLAADGHEVGRLALVHGRFTLGDNFRDDYPGQTEIDGRKLDVSVDGQQLFWETQGFEPHMNLPGHPPGREKLAAFLADPHVNSVLTRWGLGFESAMSADVEEAYANITVAANDAERKLYYGSVGLTYNGTYPNGTYTYGLTGTGLPMNTCNGGAGSANWPRMAIRLKRTTPTYTYPTYMIAQFCNPSGTSEWFGLKECPNSGTQTNQCGTASGACVSCPGYAEGAQPATNGTANSSMSTTPTGAQVCYFNSTDVKTLSVVIASPSGNHYSTNITSNIPGFSCSSGTCSTPACTNAPITLKATASLNWIGFTGGGCSGSSTSCTTTMSAAQTVRANWSATYLPVGYACWSNGTDYGNCEPGVTCTSANNTCKYWETCYCGGVAN